MSDDRTSDTESFRDRVLRYLRSSANHREKIPFLFVEHYKGNLPETPPVWVEDSAELSRYWDISNILCALYSYPLEESFDRASSLLDHANRYRSTDVRPDHQLWELSGDTDLSYKDWCRNMETYLRERGVKSDP